MRILITGATGQVGSALAQRLRSRAMITLTDHSTFDLTKLEAIPGVLNAAAPELVINAAAYTFVDRAEVEPALAHLVNASAPGTIAHWCAAHNVPLIHFSTDYVFDGSGTQAWSELDAPRPLSTYGASKLAGEEQIRAAGGSFLIIRTCWVYAAQGANFMRKIASLAQANCELQIVADQIGAPTSARFIANAVSNIISDGTQELRDKACKASGIVHLAASGETSWFDFAIEIVEGLNSRGIALAVQRIIPTRTQDYPLPARRPLNSRLDLQRAKAIFRIQPPNWRSILKPELDDLAKDLSSARVK